MTKMRIIRMFLFLIVLFGINTLAMAQNEQFKALLFTGTTGYRHASIEAGVKAMQTMAEKHFFILEWTEDSTVFDTALNGSFDLMIFLNTSGDFLSEKGKTNLKMFVENGGGFVGIHGATASLENWPWYAEMIGAKFAGHPYVQTGIVTKNDVQHPSTYHIQEKWLWTDEWYVFTDLSDNMEVLLEVDESSYDPTHCWEEISGMGDSHPVAWVKKQGQGSVFYTALGHLPEAFSDELFLNHIMGGIYWVVNN